MSVPSRDIGGLQSELASVLVDKAPEDYATIIFRAEIEDDNGAMTCWYTLLGSDAHQHLQTEVEEYLLCEKIRDTMAGPATALWKVVLLQIDGQTGQFNTQFEYDDPTRWDTAKYRPE